ncbi:MAG: ABC transporter substrate-binding protein [Thermomicrobiales bacterium]
MTPPLNRRTLIAGSAAALTLTALNTVQAQDASPVAGQASGSLRAAFVGNGSTETLDPADPSSNLAWARILSVYEPLATIRDGAIAMVLAESITPNADGSVWSIRLRKGVTFHSGRPLTTADVLATFTAHPSPYAASYFPVITTVSAADSVIVSETEIDLALSTPMGSFIDFLPSIMVIPADATLESLQTAVDGTGPFMLEQFEPGNIASYRRNPTYWGPAEQQPLLDTLDLVQLNDSAARLNALLAGQIDVACGLGVAEGAQLEATSGFSLLPAGHSTKYTPGIVLRTDRPPFDNPEVRNAVRMAIDRKAVLDTLGMGRGRITADTFVVDGLYSSPNLTPAPYDPDKARMIVEAAGLKGTPVDILTSSVDAGLVELATLFSESLTTIGFDATLEVAPAESFWLNMGSLADATAKSMVSGVNSYLEYASFSYLPGAVFNLSGYDNADVTALIGEANAATNFAERQKIAHQVQVILSTDGPDIVPVALFSNHGIRDGVSGIQTDLSGQFPTFGRAWIAGAS